jgi:hypothetical protein
MLVSPGRPKIVQVQRHPSTNTTSKSSLNDTVSTKAPETPQLIQEISAFSPYDTPLNHPDPPVMEAPLRRRISSKQSLSSVQSLVPMPLLLESYHRIASMDSLVSTETRQSTIYSDFSPSDSQFILASATASSTSWSHTPQAAHSPSRQVEVTSRCWKLEQILQSVTKEIESFPNNVLQLDSPAILELRHSNIADEIHILRLRKVFPHAATLLLSALAAWLIVDLSLLRLDLDTLEPRNMDMAAASNDGLHQIPVKACKVLGIRLPEATEIQAYEQVLRNRARLVVMSVGAIGQRLMKALRGSWDEDLWRSLRVLVEVIEAGEGGMLANVCSPAPTRQRSWSPGSIVTATKPV